MSMDRGTPTSPRPQSERSRGFSFHSQNSGSKKDFAESPEEKRKRDSLWKGQSKANPNAALAEAQPGGAFDLQSLYFVILVREHHCLSVHFCCEGD